ncbi:outer membrane transport energization protein TonB [Balneicella halophila]|uniref:Outer membrane transport energization protein TonB n=1 Tax=Balneicella halophila TaxID=1537566 RepID=A0A7L4US95_BALHA|nr:energy transducer TonB [Balneicella halophila]PVX52643.1 outer membrane transport energization protein TonB [Balneicella halophila]
MELKKSPKADLEKRRTLFLEIGLVAALLFVWAMFEWSVEPEKVDEVKYAMDQELEEDIVITRQDVPPPPPPPPPPKQQQVIDVIEVTEEKLDVKDEIQVDAEADVEEVVEVQEIEEEEEVIEEQKVFVRVEKMPEYPGGTKELLKYLAKNIKYPQIAADNGIQGKVYLKFVVEKDGKVGDVQVLRSPDKLLEKEAVRVVKTLPKFSPGMQRGKPVRVWYQVPVTFKLQ